MLKLSEDRLYVIIHDLIKVASKLKEISIECCPNCKQKEKIKRYDKTLLLIRNEILEMVEDDGDRK